MQARCTTGTAGMRPACNIVCTAEANWRCCVSAYGIAVKLCNSAVSRSMALRAQLCVKLCLCVLKDLPMQFCCSCTFGNWPAVLLLKAHHLCQYCLQEVTVGHASYTYAAPCSQRSSSRPASLLRCSKTAFLSRFVTRAVQTVCDCCNWLQTAESCQRCM
jgi:hypothetical protein